MELNEVMRSTFAARDYTGEDVPDAVLYEILENARFAPSGGNRQGNRVIVVRDPETRAELGRLAEPAAKRYMAQSKAGGHPAPPSQNRVWLDALVRGLALTVAEQLREKEGRLTSDAILHATNRFQEELTHAREEDSFWAA